MLVPPDPILTQRSQRKTEAAEGFVVPLHPASVLQTSQGLFFDKLFQATVTRTGKLADRQVVAQHLMPRFACDRKAPGGVRGPSST
jgi:hypothetical protein